MRQGLGNGVKNDQKNSPKNSPAGSNGKIVSKNKFSRALVTILSCAALLVYGALDAIDIAPGFLTTKPPHPSVAPIPTFPAQELPSPKNVQLQDRAGDTSKALSEEFSKVLQEFKADPRLEGAKASLWIQDMDGKTLADFNGKEALTPASSTKVLTAAATLHTLGEHTRLRTIVYWQPISRTLYLLAGGDMLVGPGSNNPLSIRGRAGLQTLAAQTISALTHQKEAGSQTRKNELLEQPFTLALDTSFFGTESVNAAWEKDSQSYVGGLFGLAIDTGRVGAGQWSFHKDPAMHAAQVFAQELDRQLAVFLQANDPETFQKCKGAEKPDGCASLTAHAVERKVLPTGAADLVAPWKPDVKRVANLDQMPEKGGVVAAVYSATLALQARMMLKESDNTVAEAFGRLLSLYMGGKPTFKDSGKAVLQAIKDMNVDVGNSVMEGCSGLSDKTHISAKALAQTVSASLGAAVSDIGAVYSNLPVAGSDGTLKNAYRRSAVAGRLHGKTGTLLGTTSLTGWFTRDGKVVIFSFILTGYTPQETAKKITLKQTLFKALLGESVKWEKPKPQEEQNPATT